MNASQNVTLNVMLCVLNGAMKYGHWDQHLNQLHKQKTLYTVKQKKVIKVVKNTVKCDKIC